MTQNLKAFWRKWEPPEVEFSAINTRSRSQTTVKKQALCQITRGNKLVQGDVLFISSADQRTRCATQKLAQWGLTQTRHKLNEGFTWRPKKNADSKEREDIRPTLKTRMRKLKTLILILYEHATLQHSLLITWLRWYKEILRGSNLFRNLLNCKLWVYVCSVSYEVLIRLSVVMIKQAVYFERS